MHSFNHQRVHKKAKVIFKIYDVISREKMIIIHILPEISKSKGNQTVKFGQLLQYNIRNIFLEVSCTKFGGETSPRPFTKI